MPRGLSWIGVCGPGVIVLGVSIGSGEFLLGPATFVKHGLSLLWVTLVAVFFQTVFNTELMRYTVATGEPVVTGFMRTRPGKTFWAWFYAVAVFPADRLAGVGRQPPPARSSSCSRAGSPRRRQIAGHLPDRRRHVSRLRRRAAARQTHRAHARAAQLGTGDLHPRRLPGARPDVRAGQHLVLGAGRLHRFRYRARRVQFPARTTSTSCCWARWSAYSGGWRRAQPHAVQLGARQGLRHGQPRRPHRAARWAARKSGWPTPGSCSTPDAANLARWRGWWRIVRVDQWGIFFVGALFGMMLPALLYVTFVAPWHRHQGSRHQRRAGAGHRRSGRPLVGRDRRVARRVDPLQDAARLSWKA